MFQLKQAQEKSQTPSPSVSNSVSRQDFNDRVMEMNSLRTELERVQKDKNIMAGLVTQMQRDMSNKVSVYSQLVVITLLLLVGHGDICCPLM